MERYTEVEQKLRTMKMDSEEIDEIIHLIFLTKSVCLQFCQRKTPHQAMGRSE
jgi:hypothetical protein